MEKPKNEREEQGKREAPDPVLKMFEAVAEFGTVEEEVKDIVVVLVLGPPSPELLVILDPS